MSAIKWRLLAVALGTMCLMSRVFAAGADDDEFKNVREIRAVETYVPYDEFLKIAGKDPNATVMTLEEYRGLVELATARNGPRKAAPLPPIEASLTEARYTGQAGEFSARFDVEFKLTVAGKEWTRADLGSIQNLGRVTLDGQPGWVVLEGGRANLLVKGAGAHTGTLSFALPLQIEDDVQKLSATLLDAASGSVRMTVPGRAAPTSLFHGPLDSIYDAAADSTSFNCPISHPLAGTPDAGRPPALALTWKRKYDSRKSDALLQATHHISYLLNPANPFFYWQSGVQIGRRKTGELIFVEPPGCRVIRLAGSGVHSWVREAGEVHVILDEPVIGEVSIVASGIVDVPAGDFNLGAPELKGARKNTRSIALYEPSNALLTMTKTTGLRELSLEERPNMLRFQWPQWDGRLARHYFVEQPGSTAGVHVTPWKTSFDTRTAALLTVGEKRIFLRSAIAAQPERGRVFTLNLVVPPQWKLLDMRERRTGRGIAFEPVVEGKEDNWTVTLSESGSVTQPVEIDILCEWRDMAWAEGIWEKHALVFTLPFVSNARRSENFLGISAHASIDVAFGDMPAWHSDLAGSLARLGVADSVLRAGLASDMAGGDVRLDLSHTPPRGEYESVLHVQTMEREMWVRDDIRVLALERARAVDELVLDLPAEAKPLSITGKGVREIAPGAKPNQRIVRFDQPWREVRMLCVEYRAPLVAETDMPVPDIRIEGDFDSRRWIVFQSAGVVSLEVKPGESLRAASLDDAPSFANPIKTGRALFAFSFAPGGKNGTFRTKNLESAPVLTDLVRELNLVTVLDESGVSRTHADAVMTCAQQYVEVRLPPNSALLALCVDGENAKPVQGGSPGAIKIPLPPRSNARVELVFEHAHGELGSCGSVEELAPDFIDFPVGATNWTVCHPPRYKFEIAGGNTAALTAREPRFFASQFFGRIFSGDWPIWSAWREEFPETPVGFERGPAAERAQQAVPVQQQNRAQELKPIEAAAAHPPVKDRAVGGLAIPEGASLKSGKLGGSARMVLSYRSIVYSAFASRAVFILAILIGLAFMVRRSFRAALAYVLLGLALGTLIPLALNWESPLLLIPFCEGLCAFALLLGAAYLSHIIKAFRTKRAADRLMARTICIAVCAASVLAAFDANAAAGEAEPVLIPYPKAGELPFTPNPKDTRVYVPKSVYLDLMSRVKPEKKDPVVDAPKTKDPKPVIVPYALGNADYELTADDANYSIKGTLEVTTFDPKGWAKVPLDFGPSRLNALTIDGQPAGVSNVGGSLFVQLNGAKKSTLGFELRGPLILEAGRARLQAQVVCGGATRLTAILPANVELDTKALPPGAWISKDADGKTQRCEIALGLTNTVALSWHSPDIRGKGEARISTHSYMQFEMGADGYAVSRIERVTADGAPVDQLTFQVTGDWEVASVSAPGLAEWTVSGEGAAKRVRLWFQKTITESTIQILGWAPLGSADVPAAGLVLENALRSEGFIGLKHGEGRHFSARSFEGLKRASQEELAASVALPENALPDRILHYNGTPGNAVVAAEPEPSQTSIETQYTGAIHEGSMSIGARVRYTVSGRAPLRYDVELPPTWEIRTVRATSMREWEIADVAGKKHLIVHFTGRATTGTEIRWSAEAPLVVPAQGSLRLDLPQPRAAGDAKTVESVDWLLAADPSLSLSQSAETTMQPVPVERAPRWVNLDAGQEWRLAFRSSKSDTKLSIDVSRQDSSLYATVVTFVGVAEEHVQIVSRVKYRIERAGRDRFSILLPAGAELTGLDAKNLRGREQTPAPAGVALTVLMQSPVSGEQIVDIAYRLPRVPGKDALAEPPTIVDAGARGVEHYAGLLPSNDGGVGLVGTSRLNPMKDAEELPFVPANISKSALAYVFSADPGWSMTLRGTGLKMEAGQSAEVVRSEIVTAIATDGGVRSVASYRVRNHALQFLEIELPGDSALWAVSIDGRSVSVSRRISNGATVLLIPLQRMTDTDLPARISIAYESKAASLPALYTTYSPKAPRVLDVPVVETLWRIYSPEDYDVSRSDGNVKEILASVRDGSRVDSSVKEIARLDKIEKTPGQRPAIRKKARQSIAAELQELNDNVTALGVADGGAVDEQAKRLSRDELQSQMSYNRGNLSLGNEWQMKLNEEKRKKELDEANSSNFDPEQIREFLDRFNFLNIQWRAGEHFKKDAPEAPKLPQADMTLEDLRFLRRFAGYGKGELPTLPGAQPPELDRAPVQGGGLFEDKSGAAQLETGGAGYRFDEGRAAELRMVQLNFRCVEVHPELTLTFRSKSATLRWCAIGALGLLAAGAFVTMKTKRSI